MARSTVLLAALALVLSTSALEAQVLRDTSLIGSRVRVTSLQGRKITGTLAREAPDGTLVLRTGRWSLPFDSIPAAEVQRVEVFVATHGSILKSTLVTTVISSAAFGLLTAATYSEPDILVDSSGDAFVLGAFAGAVVGLPLGLIIGLVRKTDEWAEVGPGSGVPPRLSLWLAPTRGGGFSVGTSIPVGWTR
jgi:hypothetical protein